MVALHLVGSLMAATDIMAFVHPCHPMILLNRPFEIYIFYVKIEQNFCDCKSVHPGRAYGNWKWSFNHKLYYRLMGNGRRIHKFAITCGQKLLL